MMSENKTVVVPVNRLQMCIDLAGKRLFQPPSQHREIDFIMALRWIREELKDLISTAPAATAQQDERSSFEKWAKDACIRSDLGAWEAWQARAALTAPQWEAIIEECARICDEQAKEPECPERAQYCADAIRALKSIGEADHAARQPIAYLVDGRIEQGLTFDRAAAETMAYANCGDVVPLCRCTCQPDKPEGMADLDELRRAICGIGIVDQVYGHDVIRRNSVIDLIDRRIAEGKAECKCDLRTRLVGDGCAVCNPKLAAELEEEGKAEQQAEPVAWSDIGDEAFASIVKRYEDAGDQANADIIRAQWEAAKCRRSTVPAQPQWSDEEILELVQADEFEDAQAPVYCYSEAGILAVARALLSRQSGEDKSADGSGQ